MHRPSADVRCPCVTLAHSPSQEQVSLHLTYVAVMAELFCSKAPAPSVGEHALGAMHLHGPPLRTDAHGWALNVVSSVLSRTGGAPPAETPAGLGARSASLTKGEELKPRLSRGGGLQAEHAAALLSDNAAEPDAEAANGDTHANGSAAGGPVHVMPEHANAALRVLRIIRDRLLHNPMVLGAVAGVITTLAVKARNRKAKLPYVRARRSAACCACASPDAGAADSGHHVAVPQQLRARHFAVQLRCVAFCAKVTTMATCRCRSRSDAAAAAGLFAFVHGIISCGNRRAAEAVLLRSVVSPVCCLLVALVFGFKGETLKIFIMQGALPQAVSSFVVFKEFKIQPEVFSTSTTVGTALCLPVMCIWYAIVSGIF